MLDVRRTQALALTVFAAHIPILSPLALAVASLPLALRPRVPRVGFIVRITLLVAALALHYDASVAFDFTAPLFAVGYAAAATLAFAVGYYAAAHSRMETDRQRISGLAAAVTGATLFSVASVALAPAGTVASRAAPSIWSGQLMNAPGLGALATLGMCMGLSALFLVADEHYGLWTRVGLLLLAASGAFVNVSLLNRTPFLAAAATLLLGGAFLLWTRRAQLRSRASRFLLVTATVIGVFAVATRHAFLVSIVSRFEEEGLRTARYELWASVLAGLLEHPGGGRAIRISEPYAHNLWLDVAWDSGLAPFILLALFHLSCLRPALSALRHVDDGTRILLASIAVAMTATMMAEPVLSLPIAYFALTCYFAGLLLGIRDARYAARPPIATRRGASTT